MPAVLVLICKKSMHNYFLCTSEIYQPTDVKCSKNAIIILWSNNSYNDSNYLARLLREAGISAKKFNLELQKLGTFRGGWAAPPPPVRHVVLFFSLLSQTGSSPLVCFKSADLTLGIFRGGEVLVTL